jgi:hypothetical protein
MKNLSDDNNSSGEFDCHVNFRWRRWLCKDSMFNICYYVPCVIVWQNKAFYMRVFSALLLKLFKVCKSVHHRTIQINYKPDGTIFQFITLTFIYSSTCFGRFPALHQELKDRSGSLWFYLRIVVIVVLCSWSGRSAYMHMYSFIYIFIYNVRSNSTILTGKILYLYEDFRNTVYIIMLVYLSV